MGRYQAKDIWGYAPSFTSPEETSTHIFVTPNKSKSYYIQYLLSRHGTSRGVRQPIGHVLKGIYNTA